MEFRLKGRIYEGTIASRIPIKRLKENNMDNGNSAPKKERPDDDSTNSTGGPVVIPAVAAFVGALIGAVVGSQLG